MHLVLQSPQYGTTQRKPYLAVLRSFTVRRGLFWLREWVQGYRARGLSFWGLLAPY